MDSAPFDVGTWIDIKAISKKGHLVLEHTTVKNEFTIDLDRFKIREVITPIFSFQSAHVNTPPQLFDL